MAETFVRLKFKRDERNKNDLQIRTRAFDPWFRIESYLKKKLDQVTERAVGAYHNVIDRAPRQHP